MKRSLKGTTGTLALSVLLATNTVMIAQDSAQAPAPDNTKTNTRDRNPSQPTADQQK